MDGVTLKILKKWVTPTNYVEMLPWGVKTKPQMEKNDGR